MRSFDKRMLGGGTVIWLPSNVYTTTVLGERVSVGRFTEIGPNVVVGDDTRIGAQCFIPEGVKIGAACFIGPKVCFTNDRFPPSPRERWEKTRVENGAAIGAGCVIVCGVTIGANALLGAGSVLTKNIPPGQTWAGNPARPIATRRPQAAVAKK